ncbi:MAG: signal recognition particle-docking protein FtsY [Erysipelotrichaceae bacterium]|nr:signal recognition particle-docking protein FtsY [Erysipelotrichaceae bacterium]
MGLFSYLKKKILGKSTKQKDKYVVGLDKSRRNFADRLKSLSARYKVVDEAYFDELEEILIEADVGVTLALDIIEATKNEARENNLTEPQEINELLVDKMFVSYVNQGDDIVNEIQFTEKPIVLLIVGVNGVGKTTTIAKLAKRYIDQGKKVTLVAADTFRAGATEQLTIWADRLKCPISVGKENADPASVAFEGVRLGKNNGSDLIIVDTAGRLQNKANLMAELSKIRRVIAKEIPNAPQETFLIIDATTGQNGVLQAKAFKEVTPLTGVVITKMDGTSKGGIILAIRDELGIPVRFIGLGEKMDDLTEFDLDQYLYGLCLGKEE